MFLGNMFLVLFYLGTVVVNSRNPSLSYLPDIVDKILAGIFSIVLHEKSTEKSQIKIIYFQTEKCGYLIHSVKAFKGTVVKGAL